MRIKFESQVEMSDKDFSWYLLMQDLLLWSERKGN